MKTGHRHTCSWPRLQGQGQTQTLLLPISFAQWTAGRKQHLKNST